MLLGFLPKSFTALLLLTLTSSPASGNPIPSQTVNNPSAIEARSSDSHGGGLKSWQLVLLVLGSILAMMLLGGLGGACEVLLHARGRIAQSNAEADAKVEAGSNKALVREDGYGEESGCGSDAATEVEVADDSQFSWQREKLAGGEDMSKDRALSRSETSGSSQTTLNGEQGSVDSDARLLPWEDPALAQFVIGDEEELDHDGEEAFSHDQQTDHIAQPMAMQNGSDSHQESTNSQHEQHHKVGRHHETAAIHAGEPIENSNEIPSEALVVAPVRSYSDGEYSPVVMTDEADYLAEYRQSPMYHQQEDHWQQYYNSPQGAYRSESDQVGHDLREVALSKPGQGQL